MALESPSRRGTGFLRRWLWRAAAAALVIGCYLLAGFYLVPDLIRSQATEWVKTNLDKPIALGDIHFNPITFTTDIDALAIPDAAHPMVAVGHLRIGFSILSLFQHAYRFTEISLERPYVRAVVRPDRSLNLIELVPKTRSKGPSPAVRIDSFSVSQGSIAFSDQSLPLRPEKRLSPITFALKDFETNQAEGGAFTLNGKSERGEGFVWSGTLSNAPIASRGRLAISALQSDTIQKFFSEMLPVTLTGGQISFMANYDFAYAQDGARLDLSMPNITVSSLSLDGKTSDGKTPLLNGAVRLERMIASIGRIAVAGGNGAPKFSAVMPRLQLHGLQVLPGGAQQGIALADANLQNASLDYNARKLELGNFTLNGATLSARRERNGRISLMTLLPQTAPGQTPAVQTPATPPWNLRLHALAINDGALDFDDRAVSPAAKVHLSGVNVSATEMASDLSQPVPLHFEGRINGKASLNGEGQVTPAILAGDLKFSLSRLPLRDIVSYMPRYPSLELRSGEASASGQLHFDGKDMTRLGFKGEAEIANFNLLEKTSNSPLFAWRSFSLKAIDYGKQGLQIGRAHLVHPLARVAVLPDRSFNFTALMASGNPANSSAPASPTAASAAALPIQGPPAPASQAPSSKAAPVFMLKRLDISAGVMGFADYSIQPNFEARIDALEGSVSNISSLPGAFAAIDLKGQVIDRFSPVTIKGTMDLMSYARHTDMQLSFRNIELPVFNPYSGRYAGYAIAKGKLTTELSYKIDNRALKADHHVIIDQLEWGEATESKDKVPLPIRLATALLKDKDGVIDLKVPVTGSLDDPKFRIGPIIWQVIGNIVEKAVTAPFRLIGSLFAGAEKAQYVDFAPGSSALPAGSAESLGALAKALVQRPELKLDIPAGPGIREDATSIEDAQIDALLMARENKAGAPVSVTTLDISEQHDRLQDLYRARLGKRPSFPDFPPEALKAAPGAKPDSDDDDRRTILETQWLRSELRPVFAPSTAQLTALGTARVTAVRDALLADGGVEPSRVFMATEIAVTPSDGHSRLELKLK